MQGEQEILLRRELFGEDFIWGVSTAAYQTEGAYEADGKGLSIWDIFSNTKGKTGNGDTGNVACDFYNRYPQDIGLIKDLNISNFRFSLSWPRILPSGRKPVNAKGIDFYNRVIDQCLELGIEPWPTIYHWDLPYQLEKEGGWTNRNIVNWFGDYVELCAKSFGDRISNWIVMNEPMAFTGAGYFLGKHAPGRKGFGNFLPAAHHAVLAMAQGGRILKNLYPSAKVGTTFSCSLVEPYSQKAKDLAAAHRVDALLNRLFIEPILGMGYPFESLPVSKKIKKYFLPGDEDRMDYQFDFIGIQNYTREVVKHTYFNPYLFATLVTARDRKVPLTTMGWEVYPPALYEMIKKFNGYPNIKQLFITENGAAFPDRVTNGAVKDVQRQEFLRDCLKEVLKAKRDGHEVDGYFVWTLTDNFEWAEGYKPRFGLVYVDFESQERIVKDSGKWYKDFLKK